MKKKYCYITTSGVNVFLLLPWQHYVISTRKSASLLYLISIFAAVQQNLCGSQQEYNLFETM